MLPMFILTRTFAISALFVGAAPLVQAAPTFGAPGVLSTTTSQPSQSFTFWTFLSAIIPSKFTQVETPAAAVPMKPAIDLAVFVGLDKREVVPEKREPFEASADILQAREVSAPIIREEPDIAARDPDPLDERAPDVEDIEDRSCAFVAICRRNKEAARHIVAAREPATEPDA